MWVEHFAYRCHIFSFPLQPTGCHRENKRNPHCFSSSVFSARGLSAQHRRLSGVSASAAQSSMLPWMCALLCLSRVPSIRAAPNQHRTLKVVSDLLNVHFKDLNFWTQYQEVSIADTYFEKHDSRMLNLMGITNLQTPSCLTPKSMCTGEVEQNNFYSYCKK